MPVGKEGRKEEREIGRDNPDLNTIKNSSKVKKLLTFETITQCFAVHVCKSNNISLTCYHQGRAKLGHLNISTYD